MGSEKMMLIKTLWMSFGMIWWVFEYEIISWPNISSCIFGSFNSSFIFYLYTIQGYSRLMFITPIDSPTSK